ncbi:MAG: hypothetical protein LBK55_11290 [Azoarcus sp.]|nr:hypothetical protein [Azoarcus sp.]
MMLMVTSDVLTTSAPWIIAIMMLVLGIWKRTSPYVTLYSDYFETKLAPAAGWHTVLYAEISRIEENGNNINIYYKKLNAAEGAAPKRIKLRLGELRETERSRFIDAFHARAPATVFATTA